MGRKLFIMAVVLGLTFGMVACKKKTPAEEVGDAAAQTETKVEDAAKEAEKAMPEAK